VITPADIAVDLGRDTPLSGSAVEQQWDRWITDARWLVKTGDGTHAGLGDLDALNQDTLDYVVRTAVVEHARRPDEATKVDVQTDGMATSRTYSAAGRGRLKIADYLWQMLSPTSEPDGAFSVRPSFEPDVISWP
jgi:hypothetical protein